MRGVMPLVPVLGFGNPRTAHPLCAHTAHLAFHSSPVRYLWRPQGGIHCPQ
ncbi:hypothetical protein CORC01_05540 [Colletotrichum orchidophilum]|uniref:Uncharacterized protein n=1 Tax=Colletotrichum orchidophilum TaxID=1209926 RepID=A0A1G4BCV7_9PEZI|nr:uncharacterized protein CORC01_05540 [Colletotrichum orchidophilum]OHE99259.1 hypothetical protein CORC01_05540 [Colletotrichum orchidophilum]